MMYELPTSVNVCGTDYDIETDFRAILDIFGVLEDPDLTGNEKGIGMLGIFYKRFFDMPAEHFGEAVQKCYWFINGGNDKVCKNATKLMDWEKDFPILIAPVNRIAGTEVRSMPYLHWWTFLSYYMEIGDCFFAQIVRIRDLKAKGKLKDKADKDFYRRNRDAVDIKTQYSETENEIIKAWT
jgi:hypothetical protein